MYRPSIAVRKNFSLCVSVISDIHIKYTGRVCKRIFFDPAGQPADRWPSKQSQVDNSDGKREELAKERASLAEKKRGQASPINSQAARENACFLGTAIDDSFIF